MHHILKCHPQFHDRIASGEKTFDVRVNDRAYQVNDTITFRRYDPSKSLNPGFAFTLGGTLEPLDAEIVGDIRREVIFVQHTGPGIYENYCVLGLGPFLP